MRTASLTGTLFLLISFDAFSQVKDAAYDLMLQQLLSHSVREISVAEAASKSTSVLFLDAREKEEYEVSHIQSAVQVGYDDFSLSSVKAIPKSRRIIVYCSVGYRSEKVAEKLMADGFVNVANLYGGIFEWVNQGFQVVDGAGKPTSSVHAYSPVWGVWLLKGQKVYGN